MPHSVYVSIFIIGVGAATGHVCKMIGQNEAKQMFYNRCIGDNADGPYKQVVELCSDMYLKPEVKNGM